MRRTCLTVFVALSACKGTASVGVLDTTDTEIDTATPGDTDPAAVDDPADTLPALPCHAWDPLDVGRGGRTYTITAGDQTGTETHTLGLAPTVPRLPDGSMGVRAVTDGEPVTNVVSMYACDAVADEVGAYEVAFDGTVLGVPLLGVADTPYRYLPGPGSLDRRARPTWEASTVWRLEADVAVPTCPQPLPLKRTTTGSFAVVGYEDLDVPGVGSVRAARLAVTQTERVDLRGTPPETCSRALEQLGVVGDATATTTLNHRWYARGIGLVAVLVVDPDDAACADPAGAVVPEGCSPALEKRLASCTALDGCP